jgi:hypothetical protein
MSLNIILRESCEGKFLMFADNKPEKRGGKGGDMVQIKRETQVKPMSTGMLAPNGQYLDSYIRSIPGNYPD